MQKESNILKSLKNLKIGKYFEFLPDLAQERVQKITTLVLTFLTLSFFGLVAINPTLSTIAKLQKELADNKFAEEKLKTKINNLSILSEKYRLIQNDLPAILSAVPKNPEVPLLAAQIQAVAKNSGVDLVNLQTFPVEVEKGSSQKPYSSFVFALTSDGSYDSLKKFLSSVGNMQRVLGLSTISITKKATINRELPLQLNLKGRAYFNQ